MATTVAATMTELRGRTARWSAAALAAPVAASLFVGTTAWAVHHDPLHPDASASSSAVSATTKVVAPTPDPTMAALRAALLANAKKVDALSKQVASVRAQAVALSKGKAPTVRSSGGYSSGGSSTTRSSGGGNQAPIVVTLPAAAAPPVQTTTGASGAKK